MITGQMLHEAYNASIEDDAYTMPWEAVSDVARERYQVMADHLRRDMSEGLAAWTALQNTPSYAEKEVRHFKGQLEEIGA